MVLPKNGIAACPQQIFDRLTNTALKLNSNISIIDETKLSDDGEVIQYDLVVKAFASEKSNLTRGVWTIHFAAPKSPLKGKYIMLNSTLKSARGLISHLAVPSDIQPNYAPSNQSLVTVTVVEEDAKKQGLSTIEAVKDSVIQELLRWFPEQVKDWRVLDVQYIEAALPELSSTDFDNFSQPSGDYSCGDSTYHGSVEGALLSAQRAIDNFLKKGIQG